MTPQLRNDSHRDLQRPAGRWWRLAGLFGLGWFVLFAVGAIVLQGEPPAYDASVADVRQFFTDYADLRIMPTSPRSPCSARVAA
jgi:hypothetical protein